MSNTPEQASTSKTMNGRRLPGSPMGQPRTYVVTPRQPVTRAQKNRARLVAAVIGGPVLLLIGILAIACGIGLTALANEKRAADEQAAAASTSADS
jgi:hypothetical protein